MADLPTPRALLFDWDGTLADSAAVIKHCYDAATTAVGFPPISMEDVRLNKPDRAAIRFRPCLGISGLWRGRPITKPLKICT